MRRKKIIILLFFACAVLIFVRSFIGGMGVKYNNTERFENLVNIKYSSRKIKEIREAIERNDWNYMKFKSLFDIQCLRKTYQGYYVVLLQDDGRRAFVFMDEEMKLNEVLLIGNMKEKEEFSFIEPGRTTEDEIVSMDENAILLPVSSVTSTAHVVREGLLVITYNRLDEEKQMFLDDPLVNAVVFYANESFPLEDNEMINKNVPYILPIDRV